jgi:hypothetical protein
MKKKKIKKYTVSSRKGSPFQVGLVKEKDKNLQTFINLRGKN